MFLRFHILRQHESWLSLTGVRDLEHGETRFRAAVSNEMDRLEQSAGIEGIDGDPF